MHLMWLHTCFHERTFVERQTYEVLIENDKEVVGNKLSRKDFFMTPIPMILIQVCKSMLA